MKTATKPKRKPRIEWGPAMAAITPQQRKFVQVLYENPGIDGVKALRKIGYMGNMEAAKKMSFRLRHNVKVLDAIAEYGRHEYQAKLSLAVGAADEILRDPKHRDRVKVLHGVLDRVGMHTVSETRVTHQISIEDMKHQLRALLAKPALKTLLPSPNEEPVVLDAHFTEVKDTGN